MYEYLKGKLISKQSKSQKGAQIILDVNNIGYCIKMNERSILDLPEINNEIKIYTSLIHKEDSMQLCGFLLKEDRDIFEILQSVSGVGLKAALKILDEFSSAEIISYVIDENSKAISKAKGIGVKLAQKIIIELKDKLINIQKNDPIFLDMNYNTDNTEKIVQNEVINEVQAVLLSLGYSINEIKSALNVVIKHNDVKDKDNSEILLKLSLEYLAGV